MEQANIPEDWVGHEVDVIAYSMGSRVIRPVHTEPGQITTGEPLVVDSYRSRLDGATDKGIILTVAGVKQFFPWNAVLRVALIEG